MMATILRYVQHLRKINGFGWRVIVNVPHVEVTGVKVGHHSRLMARDLIKSYVTRVAAKSTAPMYGSDTIIQNLEAQIKRSGRVTKSEIEKALAEAQATGTISSLEALLLIRSCGKPLIDTDAKESIELVEEVWDTLERLSVPIDISHYNTLLNVYLEKDHEFSVSEFLSKLHDNSIEPNRVTYHRLISKYCEKGDIAGATKILEIMREKGMALCENVFNSLIIGHSEANDMESAVQILKVMENAGITPSADTYAALMCAYAKRGDIDSINMTLSNVENTETFLLDTHLMEVIYTLAANGHIAQAQELIKKLPTDIVSDTEVGRLLIKLVNLKQIDLALNILKHTATDPTRHKIRSTFIIKTAIKDKSSTADDIIEICRHLEDEMLNDRAFQVAVYHSLTSENSTVTIGLMKAWASRGAEIRSHYFWPLLRTQAKLNNYDNMLSILKSMVEDFKITPSLITLRDYVIPYMFGTWENIIERLRSLQIPRNDILTAIADRSLVERKLRNTAMFMTTHPAKYSKDIFLPHLAEALNNRDDTKSFVIILRFLNNNNGKEDPDETPIELVDEALTELLKLLPAYRYTTLVKLIEEFVESGLTCSPKMGQQLKDFFDDNITPEINGYIEKLASGNLKQVPMTEYNPYLGEQLNSGENSERSDIIELRRNFAYHVEKGNEEKILEILQQLNAAGYESAPVFAQAIELFCQVENIQAAELYMNKLMNLPIGKLDNRKIIKYVTLLVKKSRIEDAIKYLEEQPDAEDTARMSRGLTVAIRELLDTMADTKNVENLYRLFNVLTAKKFIEIDNYSLGPLVKIHILRDDLKTAIDTFERACIDHKCTPYKNVLAIALIEKEDANSLQKLTDLCTEIHGESNALVDLALVFLDCGRLKQARKILETSGIQMYKDKVSAAIERYDKLGKSECLENLTKITRGVMRMDRAHMYENLLEVYDKKNDWQRGLALWTEIQEDDVQPTNNFLNRLGKLLKKNNQDVPFVYDNTVTTASYSGTRQETKSTIPKRLMEKKNNSSNNYDKFQEMLMRRDYVAAEKIANMESLTKTEIARRYGLIIKALIAEDQLDNALEYTKVLLQKYHRISQTVFRDVSEKLINAGRYNDLKELGGMMDENLKEKVKYYKIDSHASILEEGLEKYIDNVIIDISNDKSVRYAENKLHFGIMARCLLKEPSCLKKFEEFANNLAEKGIDRGMHVLWNYHFYNNNTAEEKMLWDKYIVESSSPLIRPIIEISKEEKNIELIKRLSDKMQGHKKLSINLQCRLASGLISVYTSLELYDDALNILNDATKRFRLNMLSRDALEKLKQGVEQSGKNFPYSIDDERTNFTGVNESQQRLQSVKV